MSILDRSSQAQARDSYSKVRTGQINVGQEKSSEVITGQLRISQVRAGLVRTGKSRRVNFGQVKSSSSQDRLSQVGTGIIK